MVAAATEPSERASVGSCMNRPGNPTTIKRKKQEIQTKKKVPKKEKEWVNKIAKDRERYLIIINKTYGYIYRYKMDRYSKE